MSSTGSGEFEWWPGSGSNSAHSSPSQLVPYSEHLDSLYLSQEILGVDTPILQIIEQPQSYYKFRYRSEMQNSHGCLHGKRFTRNSSESRYPGVELFNYNGLAVIRCKLAQINNDHEHPHELSVDGVHDIRFEVPQENSYKAWFSNLCIIHTPAREVKNWLFRGHDTEHLNQEEKLTIRRRCENLAKMIQLNIVRLKFTAHDHSGQEICPPVFSDPIKNLKSASTNILKICRMSHHQGRARGGDDVIMLVEKLNKKHISIRFFELNEHGEEIWHENGRFLETDVHRQCAIPFSTPPYKNIGITRRTTVYVELVRSSDGSKSSPVEFVYTPEPVVPNKKRKLNHFYESQHTVPTSVTTANNSLAVSSSLNGLVVVNTGQAGESSEIICSERPNHTMSQSPHVISHVQNNSNGVFEFKIPVTPAQMNNTHTVASTTSGGDIDMDLLNNPKLRDYFDSLLSELGDLIPDSGRGKKSLETVEKEDIDDDQVIIKMMAIELQRIVEMIRIKRESFAKRLQALLDLRLSNGDTFLHLTLDSKQPLLAYLISLIHDSNLTHLLNLKNVSGQTILHQAVANNLCDLIPLLVSKGGDPMQEDEEGNNAIHYGAKNADSLGPLLEAIEKFNVSHDLDAYNYEKQTPLHLAVLYNNAESARVLLTRGAGREAREAAGRTPLHLAASRGYLPLVTALLEHMNASQINEVDGRGYTALQIVCDSKVTDSTIEMVKLLLDRGADPTLHQDHNFPAWRLAKSKPALRELLQEYIPSDLDECDSEEEFTSEEEFCSADEGVDSADTDEDVPEIRTTLEKIKLNSSEKLIKTPEN